MTNNKNTYHKRVAFCIAESHTIAHGGIGQFAKGFVQMSKTLGWKVDLILDKKPGDLNQFLKHLRELGAGVYYPPQPYQYSRHSGVFAFADGVNFEKVANFRDSLMYAFSENLYDMILCNTLESMPAAYSLDLHRWVKLVFYTHNESMVFKSSRAKNLSPFTDSANHFFDGMLALPGISIGTQTLRNQQELANSHSSVELLPMPMTELELLKPSTEREKAGALFVGRWEEGKNPQLFLDVVKELGVPAKVMTSKNSAKKFIDWFTANGVADFDVRAGIVGDEKVEFIKSAAFAVNPSKRESFGFALWECLGHMPCFVDGELEWPKNFSHHPNLRPVSGSKAADWVKAIRGQNLHVNGSGLVTVIRENKLAAEMWKQSLEKFVAARPQSLRDQAKIMSKDTWRYSEFIRDLGRAALAIDDVKSVLSNQRKFATIYTDDATWLSRVEGFLPPTETNPAQPSSHLLDLFT